MISKLDDDAIQSLMEQAFMAQNGISRICFHPAGSLHFQCMLIAFRPSLSYPVISDNLPGQILFVCIRGSLTLSSYCDNGYLQTSTMLMAGEALSLPRSTYRSTYSHSEGSVFLEVIDGPFEPSLRRYLDQIQPSNLT